MSLFQDMRLLIADISFLMVRYNKFPENKRHGSRSLIERSCDTNIRKKTANHIQENRTV